MIGHDSADGEPQRRARGRGPGRPERPLDPCEGPLSLFAHQLRQLRAAAGYPSYRVLAGKALFSPSVLSTAASGSSFPSLQVTLAYAGACGADTAEWRFRWEAAAAELARQPQAARIAATRPAADSRLRVSTTRLRCRPLRPARLCTAGLAGLAGSARSARSAG